MIVRSRMGWEVTLGNGYDFKPLGWRLTWRAAVRLFDRAAKEVS